MPAPLIFRCPRCGATNRVALLLSGALRLDDLRRFTAAATLGVAT